MTNEEAIKILRDTPIDIRSTREDDIHTLYATAQNMAIDALRQTKQIGCTGCEHYDQQQTRLICHDCRRYYSDKYKGGEDDADE